MTRFSLTFDKMLAVISLIIRNAKAVIGTTDTEERAVVSHPCTMSCDTCKKFWRNWVWIMT